jgi:TP901-1 family phage major tail protein
MGKANVVAGKDLMIFVNTKPTALATSHSLSITAETNDAASKDDGAWGSAVVTKFSWEGSTEALVSMDDEVNSFDAMFDAMMTRKPVDIVSGRPVNASDDGVPEDGWTAPTTKYYKGKALITSLQRNDPNGDNSTMTVTFTGVGKLERMES